MIFAEWFGQFYFPFFFPGGTDLISCFAGQNPTVPVHRGELQSRNLGMAVECWNIEGRCQSRHDAKRLDCVALLFQSIIWNMSSFDFC